MQSLLVKLASIAVMVHMTLGCNWHHGIGVQACAAPCSTTICNHDSKAESDKCGDGNHEHGFHDHDQTYSSLITIYDLCENNSQNHFGCQKDGCTATKLIKFVFWPAELSAQYLCGAENSALVANQNNHGLDFDPFPDCSHTEKSVRAHLLFGVQLL